MSGQLNYVKPGLLREFLQRFGFLCLGIQGVSSLQEHGDIGRANCSFGCEDLETNHEHKGGLVSLEETSVHVVVNMECEELYDNFHSFRGQLGLVAFVY